MKRLLALAVLLGAATVNLSCGVNDYCLNCATGDGGPGDGGDDATDGDIGDGGVDGDSDGGCVNTGPEVCDGDDNDCDGATDEGQLPTIGDLCDNQMGECAGGVKECTNGVVTCSRPAVPEICDLLDNDCNGLTDEGDPGGGATCGTNTGECVAGVNRCVSGQIQCVGAVGPNPAGESCNNRDDDCDGMFDENLTLGPCVAGVDGPSQGNTGECSLGMRQCIGGVTTCVGAVFPVFELCDQTNLDQDCDGQPNNGYNLNTDPQNCGSCGNVCNLPNAFEGCGPPGVPNGTCKVIACAPNFFNNDGIHSNGCEFNCGHPFLGNEVCNGIDDDCDGLTDAMDPDLVAPIGLCNDEGACATGTVLSCDGMAGWRCHYNGPNVQVLDPGAGMNTMLAPETRCDSDIVAGTQADNDCDGRIDEGQANLGDACDNGMFGVCRSSGAFVCNAAMRDGPATCNFTQVGSSPSAETCDGLDNNCNNQVDEGASTGNLPGIDWVTIPGPAIAGPAVQIMKYEASRPDATATSPGIVQTHVCSHAGEQPWTNVTYPQAVAACSSIGARLCTEAEWQSMCVQNPVYPVTATTGTGPTDFTFIEAEDPFANTTIGGRPWNTIRPLSFNGRIAMQVADNGFAETNSANALANSSRLDYRVTLPASTAYRVWMRMQHTTPIRGSSPATASLAPTSPASTAIGDLVLVVTWSRSTNNVPTHNLQTGFTSVFTQDLNNSADDARMSVAYRVATVAGAQTYQAFTATGGTGLTHLSGIVVIKVGRFDIANLLQVRATNTDNTDAPNSPTLPTSGGFTVPSMVFTIGGWRLPGNEAVGVGAPASFSLLWEHNGTQSSELAIAWRAVQAGFAINPGAFTDTLGNDDLTGSISATVSIGLNSDVWQGLAAGTNAGAANAGRSANTIFDQWEWVAGPSLTSGAAGTHTFSLYTGQDGVLIDTIAFARQGTTAPTFDNIWAYANNPRTAQPQTCNSDELDTSAAAGDQDDVLPTGNMASCFVNEAGSNDVFDMSGNVKEWTQARAAGQNPIRGGASNNLVNGTTCQLNFTLADNDFFFPNVGFRCCR